MATINTHVGHHGKLYTDPLIEGEKITWYEYPETNSSMPRESVPTVVTGFMIPSDRESQIYVTWEYRTEPVVIPEPSTFIVLALLLLAAMLRKWNKYDKRRNFRA